MSEEKSGFYYASFASHTPYGSSETRIEFRDGDIPFVTQWPGGGATISEGGKRLTLNVSLPSIFHPKIWHFMPKHALRDGSPDGWYLVEMESSSTGKITGEVYKDPHAVYGG